MDGCIVDQEKSERDDYDDHEMGWVKMQALTRCIIVTFPPHHKKHD